MSDDLVTLLRNGGFLMVDDKSSIKEYYLESEGLKAKAADRIEKLEAALRTMYDCCDETGNCSVVRRIVRKALEGKDE